MIVNAVSEVTFDRWFRLHAAWSTMLITVPRFDCTCSERILNAFHFVMIVFLYCSVSGYGGLVFKWIHTAVPVTACTRINNSRLVTDKNYLSHSLMMRKRAPVNAWSYVIVGPKQLWLANRPLPPTFYIWGPEFRFNYLLVRTHRFNVIQVLLTMVFMHSVLLPWFYRQT